MRFGLEIRGVVQGVGFRPFIYNLATSMGLLGYVSNSDYGVSVLVDSSQEEIDEFIKQIKVQKPQLSEIESIKISSRKTDEIFSDFTIQESQISSELSLMIPSDIAMCQECQEELEDRSNRRYQYPFISCVNCGPRFSIIKNLPYDRDKTSMDKFPMCKECENEYTNPKDRRYHAQPIGCFECGPKLSFSVERAVTLIQTGKILAIKGVGGYHLVCDATNDESVKLLRERKERPSKPFAVMVKSMEAIKDIAYVNKIEQELLTSNKKPIILLRKKEGTPLSNAVALNINQVGLFLAPTPLHHLILQKLDNPIVATSANISGEPICVTEDEIMKLSHIWDYLLDNDRDILNSCDDSVVFVESNTVFMLRMGRSYAPKYLKLLKPLNKKILCLGANQKSTVAIVIDDRVILSSYIGDLDGLSSIEHFKSHIDTLKRVYNFDPDVIVCDKHPNYESTKFAFELKKQNPDLELIQVQHHYAHVLATMGVNDIDLTVLGVSFDGTGYGEDSNIWGGEFFVCDRKSYKRVAHFKEFKLLGAEKAIKEPRRVALSFLFEIYGEEVFELKNSVTASFSVYEIKTLYLAWEKGLNSPLSSSVGRLFDCVASLLGVIQICSYEGESGLLLESLYNEYITECYEFNIENGVIDFSEVVIQIMKEKSRSVAISKFFNTIVEIIYKMSQKYDLPIVISGGVFQNRVLLRLIMQKMPKAILPKEFVSNDSAIAYGQAIAATNNITFLYQ
ncbi:MAG: carbamoyltransferase HypF [Campylobacterota bacterium]